MLGSEFQLQTQCESRVWLRTEALNGKTSPKGKASNNPHNNKFSTRPSASKQAVRILNHNTHIVHPLLWSGMSKAPSPCQYLTDPNKPGSHQAAQGPALQPM